VAPLRVALVMSHADRRMDGARRELHFLAAIRRRGVEARLFRMHDGPPEQVRLLDVQVPCAFLPVDDPAAPPMARQSTALVAALRDFRPSLLLFKGLGYAVNTAVAQALAPCPVGLIAGGNTQDRLLDGAVLVLAEHEAQCRGRDFAGHHAAGRTLLLPKFFDAGLAEAPQPKPEPRFAIVSVGSFQTPRKNQAALFGLGRRHRICLVGGGALLEAAKAAAPSRIRFVGARPSEQVYGWLHQARIMVHPSLQDGLPRAVIEAMACGLPVVAFRDVIPAGIRHGETGLLVTPETLEAEVEALLADAPRLAAMGEAARVDAFANHGPAALQRAARAFLEMLARLGLD